MTGPDGKAILRRLFASEATRATILIRVLVGVVFASVLAGLLTRLAAVPLIFDMLVAVASTKIPILLGHGYFLFSDPSVQKYGLWSMLHEARTDLSMLLGSLFLLIVGSGPWSVDSALQRRLVSRAEERP
jgi:uncharacterized membrane protein YphA (DoxX/SURF4 family)